MALLAGYAITPDVFDVNSYSTEDEYRVCLGTIREAMRNEGLVRDLRDGAWSDLLHEEGRHRWGRELLKKMAKQGRLLRCRPVLPGPPADDLGWCAEALATEDLWPFDGGVITTESVKKVYSADSRVARIDRLASARWWASRSPSVRLGRRLAEDYERHLGPVLRFSNSLMFIDPHLDPTQRRYGSFGTLLQRAGNRVPAPQIEIHRVCYEGSGPGRRLPMREDHDYFRRAFRVLAGPLRDAGLGAEVFIWSDFHDRYLLSNLVGISLPNGFDVSGAAGVATTWTRLGGEDRDDVQREFDPDARPDALVDRFAVRP